jgi:hypothetical protein
MKLKTLFPVLAAIGMLSVAACNKYADVTNSQMTGHVYIKDPLSNAIVVPAKGVTIYLNSGTDTTSYILQTTTDSVGYYSLPSFGAGQATLYTRFVVNNAEYRGAVAIPPQFFASNQQMDLDVSPVYVNGVGITFENNGGPIPNYPFRLYTSKVAAMSDSVRFANVNTKTNSTGQYIQYNISAFTYYITAIDSINGKKAELIDSVSVKAKGLTPSKVIKIN